MLTSFTQVYISIGSQIEKFASKSRLQEVIFGMRPRLKEGKYDEAMEQAVIDIGLILAGSDPGSHHKGFRWSDIPWIPIAFIGGFISLFAWYVLYQTSLSQTLGTEPHPTSFHSALYQHQASSNSHDS